MLKCSQLALVFGVLFAALNSSSSALLAFHSRTTLQQTHRLARPCSRYTVALLASAEELRDRFCLYDRFDRWRYLQYLLEEDTESDDTNAIIYACLAGYLKQAKLTKFGEEEGSPVLTKDRQAKIEYLLSESKDRMVLALTDESSLQEGELASENVIDLSLLLDLLPDPSEDEDAFKGLWDSVIELHGRESVKLNEQAAEPQWYARCLIARLLIYYDFLSDGLRDAP
jgi:hypothetical protein